jgi:methylmalonyl-CoA mutase N-terminal domain/subunit
MRQLAGLGGADSTNARFKYLLAMGETGLSLAFDLPTQLGLDPDDPRAEAEVGLAGVSIATVDDLAAVFEGIPLDEVSVSMTINSTAPILLAMWCVVAEESGVAPERLRGTLQNEMLKEFLARKTAIFDLDTSMRYSLDVLEYCLEHLPHVNGVSLSGGHAREAGASRSLEVACAIADAETYLVGLVDRGLSVDRAAAGFSFIFGSHMEVLAEAAKFRVARSIFATRMRDKWGARDERTMKMRIQVNTFGSALAYEEPLNNIVRATLQAVAAVLGGVQSLHVCGFDEAHAIPGELSARIALRTQQILALETDLPRYTDPLGGSVVLEELVATLTTEVEEWLEKIEVHGGMLGSLRSGWLEGEIEEFAYRERGPVVGVVDTIDSETERQLLASEGSTLSRASIRSVTRSRSNESLSKVRQAVRDGENVLPALIEAARARASLGEMTEALAVRTSDDTGD